MLLTYVFLAVVAISMLLMFSIPKRGTGFVGATSVILLSAISIACCLKSIFFGGASDMICQFEHELFGHIDIMCDGLSTWFVMLISFVFIVGVIYGVGYLGTYEKRSGQTKLHWITLMLTYAGMVVMMLTNNLIVFLIGWELMAIGSFFAVIFESEKPLVLKAGINYFIQSHIAVLMLTIAFVWVYSRSGMTTFDGFEVFMKGATAKEAYMMMFLLVGGFGFKAGLVPFHSWLPYAHPAAPSHVSALMSGVIVKAGIYGIIRFGSYLSFNTADVCTEVGIAILALGVISGMYGIINATIHRDFKRMLAYCTIENIGIIAMGIGVGYIGIGQGNHFIAALGFIAALMHTVNHALFKVLLFFGAGNVYVVTHTRNMEELGGLVKSMPRTAVLFLIGAIAIGGLPPFGGFISEIVLYYSFVKGMSMSDLMIPVVMVFSGACLAVIGGTSMLAFTKSFGIIFLGEPRKQLSHVPHEVGATMLWPGFVLILPILLMVIFAKKIFKMASAISVDCYQLNFMADEHRLMDNFTGVLGTLSVVLLIFMALVALVIFIRYRVISQRNVSYSGTWGCGYMRPIPGIQYTSKSFARTLMELFKLFIPTTSRYKEITTEEVFPKERSHITSDGDFVEKRVITPVMERLFKGLDRFQFIQNGNLQLYIVYGLAWIIVLILSMAII